MLIDRGKTQERRRDLAPSEIAMATGLSTSLIYREIERGNLAAYRVGTRLRVEEQAYLDWKERSRVRPRKELSIYEPLPRGTRGGRSAGFGALLDEVEGRGRGA